MGFVSLLDIALLILLRVFLLSLSGAWLMLGRYRDVVGGTDGDEEDGGEEEDGDDDDDDDDEDDDDDDDYDDFDENGEDDAEGSDWEE